MDLKVPKVTQRRVERVEKVKTDLYFMRGQEMKVLILHGIPFGLTKKKQIYLKQFIFAVEK